MTHSGKIIPRVLFISTFLPCFTDLQIEEFLFADFMEERKLLMSYFCLHCFIFVLMEFQL